jgi:hypothetical protein
MGFTYKNSAGNGTNTFADSVSVTLTGTAVSAGDLIVCWCGWAIDGLSWSVDDGSASVFEQCQINTQTNWYQAFGQFIICRSSVATGLPTYTFNIAGAFGPQLAVHVITASDVVAIDSQVADQGSLGGTIADSGALPAISGSDVIVFGGLMIENSTGFSGQDIDGAGAVNGVDVNAGAFHHQSFYQTGLTGTPHVTAILDSPEKWLMNALALKINNPITANKVGSLLMAYQ